MNYLKKLILLTTLILTGCSGGGEAEADCSGVEICTVTESPAPLPRRNLRVMLETTEFYNPNTDSWLEFEFNGDSIDLGVIDAFSDNIGLSQSEALSKVESSATHRSNPELFEVTEFNTIPYIKMLAEDNNSYLVNYQKINSQSMIQEEVTFSATIKGDYVYIPLVNEQFSGKLQTTQVTSESTLSFEHIIRIAATSSSSINDSIHKTIKFKLNPQTKLQGVKVEFSEAANNFALDKRWETYFNGVDYSPNRDFDLVSLVDNQEYNEAIPFDVKVVFKQAPVVRMRQSVFVEETIDLNLYRQTKEIFVQRGNSFIESVQTFDSDNHFQKKVKINGEVVTLASGREGIKRNISAGEDWRITFTIDFLKNQAYDPTVELLSPLRPMCQIINNQIFYPIATKNEIDTLDAAGGKGIYCHPDTHKKELIAAKNINSTSLALDDLWNDFFFYRPQEVIKIGRAHV